MFERWFGKDVPLTGIPQVRRQKTYSAQSGFVYQYYYGGRREYRRGRESGIEYVFEVSADRKTTFAVSVRVSDAAVGNWEGEHGRALVPNERYAIAKMALFQAFDERTDPAAMREDVVVRAADVDAILAGLNID